MFTFFLTRNICSCMIRTSGRTNVQKGWVYRMQMKRQTRKKYRIKSRVRFTVFIVLMLLVTATAVTTFLGFNNADGMTKPQYIQVQVESGDTLWSIAEQYMPADMDRRESVHIISKTNETSASKLYPGQTLKIPVKR